MAINEKSLQNLRTTPFSVDNPPPGTGRPKGVKNRRTYFQEWLSVKTKGVDPEGTECLLSQMDQIVINTIDKAKKGDMQAVYLVMDSTFGKMANKTEIETPEKKSFDISKLSEDELRQLQSLYAKGAVDRNSGIQEAEIVD